MLEGVRPEILFVDNAVVTDHEGFYSGNAVLGGRGDESEAPDHDALDYVIELSKGCGGTLSFEDFEEVPVIGLLSGGVTLCDGLSDLFADWALPGTVGGLPCESVLFAGRADDALCVFVDVVEVPTSKSIFVLGFDEAVTDLDGVQFIGADAAVKEFLLAGLGVEGPFAVDLDDGYREGPVLVADDDEGSRASFWIDDDFCFFFGLGGESQGSLAVLGGFTGEDDLLAVGAEDLCECGLVGFAGGGDEGIGGLLRSSEGFAFNVARSRSGGGSLCRRSLRAGGGLIRAEENPGGETCPGDDDRNPKKLEEIFSRGS